MCALNSLWSPEFSLCKARRAAVELDKPSAALRSTFRLQNQHGFVKWIAGAFCILGLSGTVLSVQAEDSVTLEEVRQAWATRQERVKTAKFIWDHLYTVGGRHRLPFGGPSGTDGPPPRDQTSEQVETFSLDGSMVNYIVDRKPSISPSGNEIPRGYRATFDGEKSYFHTKGKVPNGIIRRSKHGEEADCLYNRPILFTYRPLHPDLSKIKLDNYRIVPGRGVVDGRSCVILREPPDSLISRSFWVDPARNFVVLRYVQAVDGKDVIRMDISYQADQEYGWVPSKWNAVWVNPESKALVSSGVAKVISYTINEVLPLEEFRIAFPPGTVVTDEATGHNYLVRDEEEKRTITPDELKGASYEQLLSTESGKAFDHERSPFWKWFLRINCTAALVICALLLWRRMRNKRRNTV